MFHDYLNQYNILIIIYYKDQYLYIFIVLRYVKELYFFIYVYYFDYCFNIQYFKFQ